MLVDQIIEKSADVAMVDELKRAPCFYIAPAFIDFAKEIKGNDWFPVLEYIRLPYETCFFEFSQDGLKVGMFCGVSEIGEGSYKIQFQFFGHVQGEIKRSMPCVFDVYHTAKKDGKIYFSLMTRSDDERGATKAYADTAYLLCNILFCLNTRNVTEIVAGNDLARLNKARLRRGKKPLLEHKTIKLSSTMYAAQGAAGKSGITHRLHLRRGHFKKRKTGVYWWSHHFAGDAKLGTITKDYVVGGV